MNPQGSTRSTTPCRASSPPQSSIRTRSPGFTFTASVESSSTTTSRSPAISPISQDRCARRQRRLALLDHPQDASGSRCLNGNFLFRSAGSVAAYRSERGRCSSPAAPWRWKARPREPRFPPPRCPREALAARAVRSAASSSAWLAEFMVAEPSHSLQLDLGELLLGDRLVQLRTRQSHAPPQPPPPPPGLLPGCAGPAPKAVSAAFSPRWSGLARPDRPARLRHAANGRRTGVEITNVSWTRVRPSSSIVTFMGPRLTWPRSTAIGRGQKAKPSAAATNSRASTLKVSRDRFARCHARLLPGLSEPLLRGRPGRGRASPASPRAALPPAPPGPPRHSSPARK